MIKNTTHITKTLGFKIFIVFILGLIMLVPIAFIDDTIGDRKYYQKQAVSSIIEPLGGKLYINGVFVVMPYYIEIALKDKDGNTQLRNEKRYYIVSPDKTTILANATMNTLSRGIFKAPIFNANVDINAKFINEDKSSFMRFDMVKNAFIFISVENKQSFKSLPIIKLNEKELKYIQSPNLPTNLSLFENGFAYEISSNSKAIADIIHQGFNLEANLNTQGGESINIFPSGGDTKVQIKSNWRDPSFQGKWLPNSRNINENGFSATWEIPSFNSPITKSGTLGIDFKIANLHSYIKTDFLLLNDNYTQIYKSIKYAILFIFVPFFALLLCEILAKREIHIVQYVLIGLANAIFYMLLLSISEHISFNLSYIISAIMVTILTGLYAYGMMKSKKLGSSIAIVEFISYAFLFSLLQLTDYALLVGTIGMFIAIAVAMYFTRNINLYKKEEEI